MALQKKISLPAFIRLLKQNWNERIHKTFWTDFIQNTLNYAASPKENRHQTRSELGQTAKVQGQIFEGRCRFCVVLIYFNYYDVTSFPWWLFESSFRGGDAHALARVRDLPPVVGMAKSWQPTVLSCVRGHVFLGFVGGRIQVCGHRFDS